MKFAVEFRNKKDLEFSEKVKKPELIGNCLMSKNLLFKIDFCVKNAKYLPEYCIFRESGPLSSLLKRLEFC